MNAEIVQSFRFEAAHFLPNVPDGHRCRNMHGHSYRVDVHLEGSIKERPGWVVDFFDVEAAFGPIMQALDHQLLNEVDGLPNPTAELIACWIFNRLEPYLSELSMVVVHETETCRASVCRA